MLKDNSRFLNRLDYDLIMRNRTTYGGGITREEIPNEMKTIELILSTRLPDESYHGIINFGKAAIIETPTDEIQRALVSQKLDFCNELLSYRTNNKIKHFILMIPQEYVYIDVAPPMTNCSTEQ